jgi:hypothetical protein
MNPDTGCGKKCDHDSPCILRADHEPRDRHETDHGCVFFDVRQPKLQGRMMALLDEANAMMNLGERTHEGSGLPGCEVCDIHTHLPVPAPKPPRKCDCFSYNGQFGTVPQVIMDPNEYFAWDAPARQVAVDACIAEQIEMLWKHKIWTASSCCGHGKGPPSAVLEQGEDQNKAALLLLEHDTERGWQVCQWKLLNQYWEWMAKRVVERRR